MNKMLLVDLPSTPKFKAGEVQAGNDWQGAQYLSQLANGLW